MNRPIVRRTCLVLWVGTLAVLLAGTTNWLRLRRQFWQVEAARMEAYRARADIAGLVAGLTDAETGQRGYLLTGRDKYLDDYHKGATAAREHAQSLDRATADAVADKLAEMGDTIAQVRAGNKVGAYSIMDSDRGKELMRTVREAALARTAELNQSWDDARQTQRRIADLAVTFNVAERLVIFAAVTGLFLVSATGTRPWPGTVPRGG